MTRREASPQLLDIAADERRKGCTDLVPLDPDVCANCGASMLVDQSWQAALFWHGGYGETQRGVARWCASCGWQGGHRRESENPRTRAHKTPVAS